MERRYYIDYVKALGCISIVALHVIANRLDHVATTELNYYLLSGLLVFTRWAVPAFVMASGCNLLGRDDGFSITKKHTMKLIVLLIIWGGIYLLADPLINFLTGNPVDKSMFSMAYLYQGPAYHLWFCFMIMGLYFLIPILNPIVKDKRLCEYLLFICIFSHFVLPALSSNSDIVPYLVQLPTICNSRNSGLWFSISYSGITSNII